MASGGPMLGDAGTLGFTMVYQQKLWILKHTTADIVTHENSIGVIGILVMWSWALLWYQYLIYIYT
jgi:hypothetical protein